MLVIQSDEEPLSCEQVQHDRLLSSRLLGGVAVHPNLPGIVVCVDVSAYDVKARSGKDRVRRTVNARPVQLGTPNTSEPVVEYTYPTFGATPKGSAWHIEHNGVRIATGKGFSQCSGYNEREAATGVAQVVAAIEQSARRAVQASRPNDSAAPANVSAPPPTSATRGNQTVTVEYSCGEQPHSSIWSWVTFTPRIDDYQRYKAFERHFGANFSRRRKRVYIPRQVQAQELLDYLVPPALEQVAGNTDTPVGDIEPAAPAVLAEPPAPPEPLRSVPFDQHNPPADQQRYASFIEIYTVRKWGSAAAARQAREERAQVLQQILVDDTPLWDIQTSDTDRGFELLARHQTYIGPLQFGVAVDPPLEAGKPQPEKRFVVGKTEIVHDLLGGDDRIIETLGPFAIVEASSTNAAYLLGRLISCRATGGANDTYPTQEEAVSAVQALISPVSVTPTPEQNADKPIDVASAAPDTPGTSTRQKAKGSDPHAPIQLTFALFT